MPGFHFRRSTRRSRPCADSPPICGIRTVSVRRARHDRAVHMLFTFLHKHALHSLLLKVVWRCAVYKDGRVCISILHDPGDDPHGYETAAERWSPVQSVRTLTSVTLVAVTSGWACCLLLSLHLTTIIGVVDGCCRWRPSWCQSFRCCRLRTTNRQPTSIQPRSGARIRRLSGSTSDDASGRVRRCCDQLAGV